MNLSMQQLVKQIRSGVIHIEFLSASGEVIGSGSGFISNDNRYMQTERARYISLYYSSNSIVLAERTADITISGLIRSLNAYEITDEKRVNYINSAFI